MKKLLGKMFMDLDKIATPTARAIFLSEKPNGGGQSADEFSFFSSIKLKNGVTKTTARNRMREVDAWLYDFLPKDEILKVLDVAISSGITTVELCELFDEKKAAYRMTAMDSDITAFLLVFPDNKSVLTDKFGNPIHFEIGGKGFGYVKGTNVRHRIERAFLKLRSGNFIKSQLKNNLETTGKTTKKNDVEIHRIELVCREIRENPSIDLLEDSIFSEKADEKYGVIRAANILNKGYFTDAQLAEAVRQLRKRLKTGGFFLVCRTNIEGQNNATLFKLNEENKFELAGKFGEGSEIEDLVFAL